jgi:septal ring factor EnvC (AmiA/AmiB activator)
MEKFKVKLEDMKKELAVENNRRVNAEQDFAKARQQIENREKKQKGLEAELGEKEEFFNNYKGKLNNALSDCEKIKGVVASAESQVKVLEEQV